FGNASGEVHREARVLRVVTIGGAVIAGSREPRDALRISLSGPIPHGGPVGGGSFHLAFSITDADHPRPRLLDRLLELLHHDCSVIEDDLPVAGSRASTVHIQVGFVRVAGYLPRVRGARNQYRLRRSSRESVGAAKLLKVG